MPALTAAPTISVFHSINKISGAKVLKYRTASEKGIGVYEDGWASPAGVNASPSLRGVLSGPGSSKRQSLQAFDTLPGVPAAAYATPKRKRNKPAPKIDLNKNMYFEDGITSLQEPDWLSDSEDDAPSDTSTLTPPPPSPKEKEPSPFRDPTPEDVDYGKHFASYYIMDGDDDNDKGKKPAAAPPVKAPKPAKKPDVPREPQQAPPVQAPYHPPPPPQAAPPQSRAPRGRPASTRPAPPPPQQYLPPVPPPRVNIVDNIKRNQVPSGTVSVAEMIDKLDILSLALVKFGGTPPSQEAHIRAVQAKRNEAAAAKASASSAKPAANGQGDETVSGLLAMFDDDDDDSDMADAEENPQKAATQEDQGTKEVLPNTGKSDTDLSYGIQFIMNALMTWAKQRIDAMYQQQWHHYNEMVRQQQQQQMTAQPKKGRGRPRKDEVGGRPPVPQQSAPPQVVNAELTGTPEGEAVQAFQDVVDCGVLKVNTIMPEELTRALGTLYVQIDHLINNSAREEPRWQCMSYQAQIKAHNSKVQHWKEQVAKMQEEMTRQQECSHQQMLAQMAVPPHVRHRGSMSQEQTLRRTSGDARHHSQSLTTPMELDPQRSRPSVVPSSSASPANGGVGHAPEQGNAAMLANGSRARDPMSHVTMYHGGRPANVAPEHIAQLQMRSGAGMKFSFEHNNEAAKHLFGQSAFPTPPGPSNIPRRGPMGPPDQQFPHPDNVINGRVPTPVLGSNAPPLNGVPRPSGASQVNGEGATPSAASPPTLDTNMTGTDEQRALTNGTHDNDITATTTQKPSETPAASASPMPLPENGRKRKHSETADDTPASSTSPSASAPTKDSSRTKLRLSKTRSSTGSKTSAAEDD